MGVEDLDASIKGFDLLKRLYNTNPKFKKIIDKGIESKQLRFFGVEEYNKMISQNFIPPTTDEEILRRLNINQKLDTLADMYIWGLNEGDCQGMSYQLSYSYNDVDIVSGTLSFLKGTKNAEGEGGHVWLETKKEIIDTSLMLVIDINYKQEMGYKEDYRITASDLRKNKIYQCRKEFTNDSGLKRH